MIVWDAEGSLVAMGNALISGNIVKDACEAMTAHLAADGEPVGPASASARGRHSPAFGIGPMRGVGVRVPSPGVFASADRERGAGSLSAAGRNVNRSQHFSAAENAPGFSVGRGRVRVNGPPVGRTASAPQDGTAAPRSGLDRPLRRSQGRSGAPAWQGAPAHRQGVGVGFCGPPRP